jgi:hypothetical protein
VPRSADPKSGRSTPASLAVALVSRSPARHSDYLNSLADAGVEAAAFVADAADPGALRKPQSQPR